VAGCANDASFPNFFGTSAATPHAAGIAALMLQANGALTPSQIYGSAQSALDSTALAMTATPPDFNSGYGFIQAPAALAKIVPGAPTISLGASTVEQFGSTTLTWSASPIATTCTASGAWSGTQKTSGTMTITPQTTASQTYTLTCADAAGSSTPASATLTVTALTAPTPTVTVAPTSISVGGSATLTWSSANATSCTASGAWTGTEPGSGSMMVSPTTVGADTYTLSCTNQAGTAMGAATLTVTAAPSHSGGGSLDELTLIALAGLGFARLAARRAPSTLVF
jgi:hypothetical protein